MLNIFSKLLCIHSNNAIGYETIQLTLANNNRPRLEMDIFLPMKTPDGRLAICRSGYLSARTQVRNNGEPS